MSEWTYSAGNHPDYHTEDCRYDVPEVPFILSEGMFIPGVKGRHFDATAEHAAEDFNSNRDGWESSWPLEIRIYEDGKEVGRFSVEREARPHFSAYALEPVEPTP